METFFIAIQENDTNTVFRMLDEQTNLVHAYYYGRLPLHVAAQKGLVDVVARLLRDGADINEENDSLATSNCHLTPLDIAISYNHPELVRLLLNSGANPNLLGSQNGSALHFTFLYARPEMAGWLLEHGANPFLENQFPYNHATPIDLALAHGQGKLVPQMLGLMVRFDTAEARSNPPPSRFNSNRSPVKTASTVFAERGASWLSAAAQHGELEAVEALLNAGVTVKAGNTNCPTLLQTFSLAANEAARSLPAIRGQWHQVQERLQADYIPRADPGYVASLRAQEADLENKVGLLAPERWQRICELLIQQGADFDAFAATALGDSNRVQQLLDADKSVLQARDCTGRTPLHWSVQTDRLPMASFWIASGIPKDSTNQAGQTALHLAAASGKAEFVKILLAADASTSIRDTNGSTALDAATQSKQADCIHLLLPRTSGSHPERGLSISLHQAAATGNIAALAALLETQPNLEALNELGLTPLQVAVENGHLAAAALLVDQGANVNARDPKGNTMLLQIIPRFFGFNVHDRPPTHWLDRMGDNPRKQDYLNYLTVGQHEQGPNGILQTVSFLLASGIDVNATNHSGQAAMQLAMDDDTTLFDDREPLIKLLQGAGATVEQRDAAGNTALHRAIHAVDANEQDALAAIIAAGADVNATNAAGKTPLHLAVEKIWGWDQMPERAGSPVQALIKAKANVNAVDNEGQTPLEVLAAADTSFKPEATRALLDAGADPKLRDKHGCTAAHLFLSGEWPWGDAGSCLEMLVQAGADLNAKDNDGKTPLHYLAGLGNQRPMFFIHGIDGLLVKARVDFISRDNDGDTPLHVAARTGTRDVFDWLVKQGAGLDETNNLGETPRLIVARRSTGSPGFGPRDAETDIFTAARDGKLEALSALIKADSALVNATNQFGQTPLRVAALSRRTNSVEFLEQHGARWDVISAVMAGKPSALREILAAQPGLVATNYYGSSLLHLAVANGDLECTRVLLNAKANVQAQDSRGLTPLGVARLRDHAGAEPVLRGSGATENIFDAAYTGDLVTTAELIRREPSLATATNSMGVSVLAIAAGVGETETLKLLLSNGASAEEANVRTGETPLHVAAIYNQTNTAKLLLQHGAKADVYDHAGFTPLHRAALQGSGEMTTLLLTHDADIHRVTTESAAGYSPRIPLMGGPNALRFSSESALHLAAVLCQTNAVQVLLNYDAPVNATDGLGRTPLDLARQANWPPNFLWIRRVIAPADPLGIAGPGLTARPEDLRTRQQVVITLLEKAGGKVGQSGQRRGPLPGVGD